MTPIKFTKSVKEEFVLEYLVSLEWQILFGPEISPGGLVVKRQMIVLY